MTDKITQIEGEFENVAMNGDKKDWNVGAKRWTKGNHDRLYLNDAKYVEYVDLDSCLVEVSGGAVYGKAKIVGDKLIVEASVHGGEKEMRAVFELPEELAEAPEPRDVDFDDLTEAVTERHECEHCERVFTSARGLGVHKGHQHSDDEGETAAEQANNTQAVVTDGGVDKTDYVDDEEIETAIEQNASEASVDEVRDILASVQRSFEAVWDMHMDTVEEGNLEVVHAGRDLVVFADHTGSMWNEEFKAGELEDVEIDTGTEHAVVQLHHTVAKKHTDYSWSTADPFVVRKPESFDAGLRFVEAMMNNNIRKGLSPGQSWAVWGVHIRGNSRNMWASRCGYSDHSAVSEPLRKVEEKLGQ